MRQNLGPSIAPSYIYPLQEERKKECERRKKSNAIQKKTLIFLIEKQFFTGQIMFEITNILKLVKTYFSEQCTVVHIIVNK